jgi:hypothetical protein
MTAIDVAPRNRLLAALPADELRSLLSGGGLDCISLSAGGALLEQGKPIDFIYFPIDSVISFMVVASQRMTLEVGLVGDEGLAGVPAIQLAGGIPVFVQMEVTDAGYVVPSSWKSRMPASIRPGRHWKRFSIYHASTRSSNCQI